MLRPLIVPLAVPFALLLLGTAAAQAEDFSPVSTTVTFSDLNLSQPADAKVLADRIAGAAKSVCLKANSDIASPALMQQCTTSAIGTGMAGLEVILDQAAHTKLAVVRTALATP